MFINIKNDENHKKSQIEFFGNENKKKKAIKLVNRSRKSYKFKQLARRLTPFSSSPSTTLISLFTMLSMF